MEKFKSFITESKNKDYKVVVLSVEHDDKSITAKRMKEEAVKLGLSHYVVGINGSHIEFNDGTYSLHELGDEKGFEISSSDTVVFIRGTPTKDSALNIISELEKIGICVVNSRTTISTTADKYRTYIKLKDYGLTQPKTELIPDEETLETAVNNLDTKFPIILKTLRGSKGVGVLFIESEKALDSIVQLIHKQDEDTDLLLQEYIKNDYDVRVLVLGGKVLATMKRPVIEGDFRSNVSLGSKPEKIKLTELEIEASLLAAKAVNGLWTAVDFIPSKNREKDPPFVIEVNSSPGTEGIEEASGQNISKEIITFFADKKNWVKVPSECGYKEVISIKPFGDLVAKFDTGNSGMPVIHAENIKVIGKQVKWTLLDKTITSDIIRKEEISVGGLRDYDEERYVIKLNVEFLGGIYETEFTLDNLKDRTLILLDREFMSRVNVMVNPDRKYVVTTKYSLE